MFVSDCVQKNASKVIDKPVENCSLCNEEASKEEPAHQLDGGDRVALDHVGVDVGDVVFHDVVIDASQGVPDAPKHPSLGKAGCVEAKKVARC